MEPQARRRWWRWAAGVLVAVAVVIAAGGAAVGALDEAPTWLAAVAAAVAAGVAVLAPEMTGHVRRKRATDKAAAEQQAILQAHRASLRRRYAEHRQATSPTAMHDAEGVDRFVERVVEAREPQQGTPAARLGHLLGRRDDSHDLPTGDVDGSRLSGERRSLADFAEWHDKVLLLGDGGLGKTTSMLALADAAAVRGETDPSAPTPIYVELKTFDVTQNGFDRLRAMAANAVSGMSRAQFDTLWERGSVKFLFLFDGLNEQQGSADSCVSALRDFTRRSPHHYVVTSRPTTEAVDLAAVEDGFVTLDLLPLSQEQVEQVLVRTGLGSTYADMEQPLKELSENPFMLAAVTHMARESPGRQLPGNIGQLYETFLDVYMRSERDTDLGNIRYPYYSYSYSKVKKPILTLLATSMSQRTLIRDDPHLESRIEDQLKALWRAGRRRAIMPDNWSAPGLVAELLANGVIRRSGEHIEFMHESVQEYYVAVGLKNLPTADVADTIPALVWRHVEPADGHGQALDARLPVPILMLSGLIDSGALVREIAPRDPYLGARCIAASSRIDGDTVAALIDEWLTLLDRPVDRYRWMAVRCLGAAQRGADQVVRRLIDVATADRNYAVSKAAGDALRRLGLGDCEDYLAARIQRSTWYDAATSLMADLAPRRALRILLDRWRQPHTEDEQREVQRVLASIDKPVAVAELEAIRSRAQRDGDTELAAACANVREGLRHWEGGSPISHAAAGVKHSLKELSEVRDQWVERLAAVGETALMRMLDDDQQFVRKLSAAELGRRGNPGVVLRLVDALAKETVPQVWQEIGVAIRRLGGPGIIADLIDKAWTTDEVPLFSIVVPPDERVAEEVPPALRQALRNRNLSLPDHPTVARQGHRQVISVTGFSEFPEKIVLVESLGGRFDVFLPGARRRLLETAIPNADPQQLAAVIPRALRDDDPAVRSIALTSLRRSRDPESVAPILDLLEREGNDQVIKDAVETLASIGTRNALDALLDRWADGTADGMLDRHYSPEFEAALLDRALAEPGPPRLQMFRELASTYRSHLHDGRPLRLTEAHRAALMEVAIVDAEARLAVAETLRWSLGDPGTSTFAREIGSPDPARRAGAAVAFGVLQEDSAVPPLTTALADPTAEVRVAAATSLLELQADAARDAARTVLTEAMQANADESTRKAAARALADGELEIEQWLAERLDAGELAPVDEFITQYLPRYRSYATADGTPLPVPGSPAAMQYATLLWLRAIARVRQGKLEEALADLDRAVAADEKAYICSSRAYVFDALQRPTDAVSAQRRATELTPGDADAHAQLGWYEYRAGDFDTSIAASRRALRLDGAGVTAAFNLALANLARGDDTEAHAAYLDALRIAQSLPQDRFVAERDAAVHDLDELFTRRPELADSGREIRRHLASARSDGIAESGQPG